MYRLAFCGRPLNVPVTASMPSLLMMVKEFPTADAKLREACSATLEMVIVQVNGTFQTQLVHTGFGRVPGLERRVGRQFQTADDVNVVA